MAERILNVGMMGEDVTALHKTLSAHGLKIPESETARGFFGPATRNAVLEIQNRNRLAPTGQVDKATAALLDMPGAGPAAEGVISMSSANPARGEAAAPPSGFEHSAARQSAVPDTGKHPAEAQLATESLSGATPALSVTDARELPERLANVARLEGALASPSTGATTLQPAPAAPTEMPVAASSAEMNVEEKKSAMVITEGATAGPFVMVVDPAIVAPLYKLPEPEPQPLTIKGEFAIFTFDKDLKISRRDFQFYELSAEISGLPDGAFKVLRCAFGDDLRVCCRKVDLSVNCPEGWSEGDLGAGIDREKYLCYTQFQFPPGPLIVVPGTTVSVRVNVKSFEGVSVWSKEYKADYPPLHDNLRIEVPLQRPITRTSATKRTKSTNDKKLRGQVLELSKKCKLKDLTVVLQAKERGDTLWRIVSAGRTDSAGNFSLPYPFGVFDEAQALVSVTPNSPATVKVTEVRNGNETIAEDFLYLLIKDIECPQDEAEADCDCNGNSRPARLPDQADLIGSDEYTQDIGGSCINLSTPNRTLSEFNYQAIVRTSDPDVANYTLEKVVDDKPKPAGIDPVRKLEISRALSALDSALRNLTFQNALPPAALNAALAQFAALRTLLEPASNVDVAGAIKSVDALISNVMSSLTKNAANAVTPGSNGSGLPQGGSVSVATIEAEILRVLADFPRGVGGALTDSNGLSWDTLEGAIRQAVINAGGAPLTPTFFFQFGGWRVGKADGAWSTQLLDRVIAKAAEAGSGAATALSGAGASALPMQSSNAVSHVIGLANDLKAYLNAAQLLRMETCYKLVPGAKKRLRERVDLDNLVAWQDDEKNMTLYQAVTVATGHVLHYKSEFKADGYSLGDVVYSLPLAPGQKKEIVVLDASHRLMGTESQTLSQGERLAAGIFDERTIISNLGGRIAESLRGASSANTSGISAGFGTGGQGYGGMGASGGSGGGYGGSGSAVIGIAGGVANANSSAWQDSSRNISQFFGETLRQSITQNANAYRQLNASVVTTVEEGQRYGVTSEVVANHNHCHALTIMYFEVLRHYAIFQRLSSVEECVFVPLLMTNFTTQNIYKWRDVLAKSLLPMPADTYMQSLSTTTPYSPQQHPLVRAFDANERILTNYANVDYPVGSYDDEPIQFIRGNMRIRVELPRPRTRCDRIMSLPITKQVDSEALKQAVEKYAQDSTSYALKAGFSMGFSTLFEKPPTDIPDPMQYQVMKAENISNAFMTLDANYESVPPAKCIRITNFKPQTLSFGAFTLRPTSSDVMEFFAENREDQRQWQAYADILGYSDVETMLNAYFKGNLISEWDSIFYTDIAPLVFEKIVSRISLSEFSTDFSSETNYEGGERAMRLNLTGTTSKKRNQLPLELTLAINDQNFKKLKEYITFNVEDLTISYSTAHYRGVLCAGNVNDDLFDDTALYIPELPDEKRNLRKEDAYLVYKLIEHLNSNIEYYNKALWYNLDPDRRYMLLDGFDIQTFNDYGLPIGRRSLASVVKNELVTITGNSLVFPVAAGYRVSQSYIVEDTAYGADIVSREATGQEEEDTSVEGTADGAEIVSLLDHYQPLTPIEPYRISVPTRGVFAEAVQGACNACEKIETDRLQDWNRFPNTDEPTAISPVTVPTPGVTDWKAAFKDFATPIVNIQNAPAAPAPGAGLAGLSELLGKSGVFKDITGLDANQQNVIRTYLSNQENAKAFAKMAKEMAMQQHNTQNSGRIMDQIAAAKNSKDITQQEAGQLVKDHLQQQIDGGMTRKAELDRARQGSPTPLTKALIDATSQGRSGTGQTIDEWGNSEAVTIGSSEGSGEGENVLAEAKKVPSVAQPNEHTCWAAAASMMCMWRDPDQYQSIDDVMADAGEKFVRLYNGGAEGKELPMSDKEDFLSALAMVSAPSGANYPLQSYIEWLKTYGPLWVTIDSEPAPKVFSRHAIVITRITGSGRPDGQGTNVTYIDPMGALTRTVPFSEFVTSYESVARYEKDTSDRKGLPPSIQVVHFKDEAAADEEGGVKGLAGKAISAVEALNKWEQACYRALSRYRNWLTHNMILFLTDFLNSSKGNNEIKEITGGFVEHLAEHALGNLAAHPIVDIAAEAGGHQIAKLFLQRGTAAVLGGVAGFVIEIVVETALAKLFDKTKQIVSYTADQIDGLVTGVVNPIVDEKQQQFTKAMQDLRGDLAADSLSADQWTVIKVDSVIATLEVEGALRDERDERLYRLMALIEDVYRRASVPAEEDSPVVLPADEHDVSFTMQHTEVKTGQTSIDVPADGGTLVVRFRAYDCLKEDGEFGQVDIESADAPPVWTRPRPPRDYNVLVYQTGSPSDTTIGVPRVYRVGFQEYGVWFNLAKGVYHLTIQRGDDHIVALCGEGKYWVKTGL